MWNWTRFAGKALINVGVLVLGLVAAKELFEAGCEVSTALQNGTGAPETDGIPSI